jgi:release factor glutamine methyltransferase
MTIRALRRSLIAPLASLYGEPEAQSIVWLLIEHATGQPFRNLCTEQDCIVLSPVQVNWLKAAHARVCAQEPVQYVTGFGHFYGREFHVSPAVLIPRPETEELALKTADALAKAAARTGRTPRLLDVGTGTGCIPITALLEAQTKGVKAEAWAIDLSEEALVLARKNAAAMHAPVTFLQADALDPALDLTCFPVDVLVSNPPYIPVNERDTMAQNVVAHEPHLALFVPDADPLLFYRALARMALQHLAPGGVLLCEIHEKLGPQTAALFTAAGLCNVMVEKDLQGKDRMVRAVAG